MKPTTCVAKDEHDKVDKILMDNLEETAKKVWARPLRTRFP